MAEAVICPNPISLHFSGEMLRGKRKTPSELRSEQLKRLQNDQDQASCSSDRNQVAVGLRKEDVSKPPRFVDARVPDIYVATKPGDRSSRFLGNEKKDVPLFSQKCDEQANREKDVCTVADRARSMAKFQWKSAEEPNCTGNDTRVRPSIPADTDQANSKQRINPPLFDTFRNVTQLSSGIQEKSLAPAVDMAKAFKGMSVSRSKSADLGAGSPLAAEALQLANQINPPSLCIKGKKLPLDLSLKTNIRFTSNTSFESCQRITNKDLYTGMQSFLNASRSQEVSVSANDKGPIISSRNQVEVSFIEALHSWTHPQSVLPSSVLSTLASSAAHGGTAERDFLSKRQLAWEDSFCSLYYMFRDGQCDLFYFSIQQFLVMFISGELRNKKRKDLSAYITRSTRGLRALLQEQDIAFTMPLCSTEVAMSMEELRDLTEFEKTHPGQTRLVDSMIAVDNNTQSVLAFNGQKSVHGLYDFLLNHRTLLSSTTGADVPLLYSPVSFRNACLVMPEVVCKQLQRPVETVESLPEQTTGVSMNTSFMLEIKGSVLPPWIVWRVCAAVQLQSGNFEASLVTDPASRGLNIAQEYAATDGPVQKAATTSVMKKEFNTLLLSSEMKIGYTKQVIVEEGSYTVTLSCA